MRIAKVRVRGFRSLHDVEIPLEGLTTLIGPNGTGKSSFLRALRLFFDPKLGVEDRHFFKTVDGTQSEEIEILVTFDLLSDQQTSIFSRYLNAEGKLVLVRAFGDPGKGTYQGECMTVPEFAAVRNRASGHTDAYNALAATGTYEGLQRARNRPDAFQRMSEWENSHPEACVLDRESFNFLGDGSAGSSLLDHVRPAFLDALDNPETQVDPSRPGPLRTLLDAVGEFGEVEGRLASIAADAQVTMEAAIEESRATLSRAQEAVDFAAESFAPGFKFELLWGSAGDVIPIAPRISLDVVGADGVRTELRDQGHGLQRSILLGVLTRVVETAGISTSPTILLGIEEPELFQHPLSARKLAGVLSKLSLGSFQVVFATHSPLFVIPKHLDGLRLFSKVKSDNGAETRVQSLDLEDVARRHEAANQRSGFTAESTRVRLEAILDSAKLEGLFAKLVVLIEGPEDRGLLQAGAELAGIDLDSQGVALVVANGKSILPLLAVFMLGASIPTYPVFDLDRDKRENERHVWVEQALMRLLEETDTDLIESKVTSSFACSERDLATEVKAEIGEPYEESFRVVSDDLGCQSDSGRKVAEVLKETIARCASEGHESEFLSRIVHAISNRSRAVG